MDEQRQQTYLQLIQNLLNCSSNDEFQEILSANKELLDAGFLETVETTAQMFSQQGDEKTANWLQGLASYLREVLNLGNEADLQSLSEEEIQAYFQFLREVLRAIDESNGDAKVVYPLLEANTDKLDGIFAEILHRWATETLREVEANAREHIARVIFYFSNLIHQFPLGNKASNMEIAIAGDEVVLKAITPEAFPQHWAITQNNLANAYYYRIRGDKAENIELAIAALTAALTVFTPEAFPQDWASTQNNLGLIYQKTNQFTLAYDTFQKIITTVESLREEIVSGEESKRKQAEQWNQTYLRMVEVCLELDNITEAIEYVERSKTRNLVEQILERDFKTIFSPEEVTQLEEYRDKIAIGQYQIQNGEAKNPQALAQELQQLRQKRNELQNRRLPVGSGFKFDTFQASLDEHTAIIEWYALSTKILAFIVTQKGGVSVWQSQPEDREALVNWANQYLQNYYNEKDQWQYSLEEELKELASILHIGEILAQIPKHCDKLILSITGFKIRYTVM